MIVDSLVVGYVAELHEFTEVTDHFGIITPRTEGFLIDGIKFMPEAPYGKTNRWLTTLTVNPNKTGINRNQIITALENENIEARPVWKPMHMQPLYKDYDYITTGKVDVSGMLFENGLCLPSGSNLSGQDQARIIDIIQSLLK